MDVHWGGFGFLDENEAVDAILWYGLSAGFFGNPGYMICLLFFSPVVVTATYLCEPFLSQLFGYLMEIDKFPGVMTWVGTIFAVIGILLL